MRAAAVLGAASAVGSGGALDALDAALGAAELHTALPYAFGCVGCLPMGVVVAGLRARRWSSRAAAHDRAVADA